MDLGSLLLGVALLLAVAFLVARPLLEQTAPDAGEPAQAEALLFERERILTALRDLDFDHATGKLVEDDYAAQRAGLLAEGAAVLRQLDVLAPGAADAVERSPDELDAEIERAIAQRRGAPAAAARFCSQCGQPLREQDRFCGACGAAVGGG